ncbi:hypothetical protein RDI58_005953 [Solanum bulbocastanum]|uniref:Uncharacterized protein n=1 Tax=Solanum bulbocastanum TaxID=147425 RepID=A0AAN8YN47_SOLBU
MGSMSEQVPEYLLWLKDLEEEGKKWTRDFSPYAMDLYKDYKMIVMFNLMET